MLGADTATNYQLRSIPHQLPEFQGYGHMKSGPLQAFTLILSTCCPIGITSQWVSLLYQLNKIHQLTEYASWVIVSSIVGSELCPSLSHSPQSRNRT